VTTPGFSIITPTLNRAAFIRDTIESVLNQNYASVEHIIVDGGSIDETMEILQEYPHLRIISERDEGMYDAINKGLSIAEGTFVGIFNSDDVYEPNVFGAIAQQFAANPDVEAVVGGTSVFTEIAGKRQIVRTRRWIEPEEFWFRLAIGPGTNAWFYRKAVFERYGQFNAKYRYAGDREFLLRAALAGMRYAPFEQTVCNYRQHPDSVTFAAKDGPALQLSPMRVQVLKEGMEVSEHFLRLASLPAEARLHLRRHHTRQAYALADLALEHGKFDLALLASTRGVRHYPLWIFYFLRRQVKKGILGAGKYLRQFFSGEPGAPLV
jgi:glycosyltransferase involved in cell wall biosynthesis